MSGIEFPLVLSTCWGIGSRICIWHLVVICLRLLILCLIIVCLRLLVLCLIEICLRLLVWLLIIVCLRLLILRLIEVCLRLLILHLVEICRLGDRCSAGRAGCSAFCKCCSTCWTIHRITLLKK